MAAIVAAMPAPRRDATHTRAASQKAVPYSPVVQESPPRCRRFPPAQREADSELNRCARERSTVVLARTG